MTSYKRCDRLLNCEVDFIKCFYPIYYNVIPYLLGVNAGKTEKRIPGLLTPCPLREMGKLPGSPGARRARAVVEHTRKPGLRGRSLRRSPLGSRAPRGEDTSEPIPRPLPGASGAVRSANGRVATPISLPNRSLCTSIGDSNP